MKRTTLESLMALVEEHLPAHYDEIAAQFNATISVEGVARHGYGSSQLGQQRDADGKATLKWEERSQAVRDEYTAIARAMIDEVQASGAFVRKDSPDEPFGVTVTA
jgi:hypothetical protein